MNNKDIELIYCNNNVLGHFDNDVFVQYSKDEKNKLFKEIEKQIIKKDSNRKLSSLIIGLSMLVVAITLAILMLCKVFTLGESQLFNFTFLIAGLVLAWIVFYYIFGFFFYSKLHISYYFKSKKTTNPNSALMYASSNYAKFVQQYSAYLKQTTFMVSDTKTLVPFGLTNISKFKNLIFNGKISSNVPYFYLAIKNERILFLPGMIIIINGKKSKVLSIDEFSIKKDNNTFKLFFNNELYVSLDVKEDFNINFFYFKYEQV